MSKGSLPYTDVEPSNWSYKTPADIQAELREAYEANDQEWLKRQAWEFPSEYLAAADAIGVDMPWGSRLWLEKHAKDRRPLRQEAIDLTTRQKRTVEPMTPCTKPDCYGFQAQVIGGPHWHVIVDGRDVGANPMPPAPKPPDPPRAPAQRISKPPAPPPPPPPPLPRERCRDCGDFMPLYRQIPWCVRCNKVRLEAARVAREQAQAQVVRPPLIYHCLACRTNIPDPGLGPRLCTRCAVERYVEQPSEDDGVLPRTTGTWPHLAFYTNRCGESVVNGRILPHPRYGESRPDRFGDTPELDD